MTQIQQYKLEQLENGGRIVSEKLPSVRSVSLGLWIGSGARHEDPSVSGASHFIEHLLFKGSSRHTASGIAQIFDSFGGDLNAATDKEYTVVHARFIDEHLEDAFEVMSDMVLHPSFADIDQEREVVVEEIAMYEDSPGELITDYLTQAIFGGHPLGKSVIGTSGIIGSISEQQLRDYHKNHYTFPNIVIAAAGNLDHEELAAYARKYMVGGNDTPAAAQEAAPVPVPRQAAERACFYRKDTQQYHVCFGGLGVPHDSEEKYSLSILDSILGSTASSRLFQEVREKRGLAYSIYSYASFYADTGLVGLYFGCRKDSVDEITSIVTDQIISLMTNKIDEEELERAKESAKGRIVLGMETTHSRMSRLGKMTVTGSEIPSIDEIIKKIDRVTAEDVRRTARDYYDPSKLTAVAIGPEADVFEKAVNSISEGHELVVK